MDHSTPSTETSHAEVSTAVSENVRKGKATRRFMSRPPTGQAFGHQAWIGTITEADPDPASFSLFPELSAFEMISSWEIETETGYGSVTHAFFLLFSAGDIELLCAHMTAGEDDLRK